MFNLGTDEVVKCVSELNQELFDMSKEPNSFMPPFTYSTDGYGEAVNFYNNQIWNSENDNRLFDDDKNDYEPIRNCLIREANKIIRELSIFKFD
jgi:hypothetical protein